MNMGEALVHLVEQEDLSTNEMADVMRLIMTGKADDAQIGAFLMALRIKGETIDEITGAVMTMRELATGVDVAGDHLVDIVGTGGDGANLFNVSTASTFIAAAAGARVAKHGNRSVSSKSGSADLLEAAGVRLDLTADQVQTCVERLGVGFMFAPMHHSAMRYAIGPRKALGLRTVFNILGPMTNPAGVKRMVIGVYEPDLCRPVAEVLSRLDAEHVLVLHANDGLDEISLAGPTHVVEWCNGRFREFNIVPEDLGVATQSLEGLEVDGADDSLRLIRDALGPKDQRSATGRKAVDMLCLNAGAALYAAGIADNLIDGAAKARTVVDNGQALEKLVALATLSQEL